MTQTQPAQAFAQVTVQTTCTHCSTPVTVTVDFDAVSVDTQTYWDGVTTNVYYVAFTCPSCDTNTDVRVGGRHYGS